MEGVGNRWVKGMSVVFSLLSISISHALIFFDDADDATNTQSNPSGDYAGSLDAVGIYKRLVTRANGTTFTRDFHGTMISPKHFITARHLGAGGTLFVQPAYFNGVEDKTFTLKNNGARTLISGTDYAIYEIYETFDSYVDLWQGNDDLGKEFLISGAGRGRGEEILSGSSVVGWQWGDLDSRWGTNTIENVTISDANTNANTGELIICDFDGDATRTDFESQGADRDSGGPWLIKDGGEWKLAGISFAVDARYDTNNVVDDDTDYIAAFFDAGGFYYGSDANGWNLLPTFGSPLFDNNPQSVFFFRRSHTYASRISSNATDILAVVQDALDEADFTTEEKFDNWLAENGVTTLTGPLDDADADGFSNLVEYLTQTNPADESSYTCALEASVAADGIVTFSVVESLDIEADGLSWTIEESSDLSSWGDVSLPVTTSGAPDPVTGTRTTNFTYTPSSTGDKLFFRLRINATF